MFADKMVVFVGENKQIKRFEASGNTSFKMKMEDNTSFEGESDEFVYTPGTGELILTGNAKIKDITNAREINGERVILYEKQKVAKVMGEEKKPVKLIFEIEDKAKATP
jgi:lipopolysaccharide export system protein LptA